jgi:hypothetical protein
MKILIAIAAIVVVFTLAGLYFAHGEPFEWKGPSDRS